MKKGASLLLLGIFLFNVGGYFIAFRSFQYHIKKEIKAEIKKNVNPGELTIIVIEINHINKIDWLEKEKEMYYNGKLYDIVKHTQNDTSITYYCIDDKQEEVLFANLEEHINTHIANNPIKNQEQKKITDNVIKLYFSNEQSIKFTTSLFAEKQFSATKLIYKSALIETDSLPPELV